MVRKYILRASAISNTKCTNNPFPVIHGSYLSSYFGEYFPYNSTLCSIINPQIIKMKHFSNEDLMLVYISTNNLFNTNDDEMKIIARIDHTSGRTVWAKAFIMQHNSSVLKLNDAEVVDDFIWATTSFHIISMYKGGFIKFDQNGNYVFSKIFSVGPNSGQERFFESFFLTLIPKNDIIINGRIMSFNDDSSDGSTIGYSNTSSADEAIFRLDQQGNIKWTTVLDFNLGYDSVSKMATYESIIYAGILGNSKFPCFFTIDGSSGLYIKSRCFIFMSFFVLQDREMSVELVTEKYIFGIAIIYSRITSNQGHISCLFILSVDTFQPLIIYDIDGSIRSYPISRGLNNSPIILLIPFCSSANIIKIDNQANSQFSLTAKDISIIKYPVDKMIYSECQ